MKRIGVIIIFFTLAFTSGAQVVFKTIVPQLPVVTGESFQVQYIIEDAEKVSNFFPPNFKGFRMVAGPNTYTGSMMTFNRIKQLTNTVYTLSANYPGRYIISGAVANINGKPIRSNDVVVEVISKKESALRYKKGEEAINSEYFLRPGEDPYEKIRKNLFLKVMVDKKWCFVGEPVVAIFKLYSRLESKSDIVKNPGFYGFTVNDMINLDDKIRNTEMINGKQFDVHTIRKVQLYPLQEGRYSIDAMEVKNNVEFSHSVVNKKTEQEIIEGVLSNNTSDAPKEGVEVIETNLSTDSMEINVKPAPQKNKPAEFNGATGNFSISAGLEKDTIAKNEEGELVVTISGNGNFTQLSAPLIQWPVGIEAFEPVVKDSLDKMKSPLAGSKTFHYAFVTNNPGNYELGPVSISFFNPESKTYKTIATKALQLRIEDEQKISIVDVKEIKKKAGGKNKNYWMIATGFLICIAVLFMFLLKSKKKQEIKNEEIKLPVEVMVKKILMPASFYLETGDKSFYNILHQCVWNYLGQLFHLSGSEMNKDALKIKLEEMQVNSDHINKVLDILLQCEVAMFTIAEITIDKHELFKKTLMVLEQIKA